MNFVMVILLALSLCPPCVPEAGLFEDRRVDEELRFLEDENRAPTGITPWKIMSPCHAVVGARLFDVQDRVAMRCRGEVI